MAKTKTLVLANGVAIAGASTTFGAWVPTTDYRDSARASGETFGAGACFGLKLSAVTVATIDISLEGAFDNVSADAFALRSTLGPSGTAAAFAQTTAAVNGHMVVAGPLPPWVRYKAVTGGASAAATLDLMMQGISVGS